MRVTEKVKYVTAEVVYSTGNKKTVEYPVRKRVKDLKKFIKEIEQQEDIIVVAPVVKESVKVYDIPHEVLTQYLVEE